MKKSIAGVVAAAAILMAAGLAAQAPQQAPQAAQAAPRPGFSLTTTAFDDGGVIPNKYTAAATGSAVSPALQWANVPDGTASFVLVAIDPDTALNRRTDMVVHWLIFNIPGTARELPEGVAAQAQLPDGSIQALNTRKLVGYMGPGAGAAGPYHHYTFGIYALDIELNLGPDATLADVQGAMQGHILGKGVLMGRFHR